MPANHGDEIGRASQFAIDSPEWIPFATEFLKLDAWRWPAVAEVMLSPGHRRKWHRKPNRVGFIKTLVFQECNRSGLKQHEPAAASTPDEAESDVPIIGAIDVAYPKFQRIARYLEFTGLPRGLAADDLAQAAALAYVRGKVRSLRDAKSYMMNHIYSERPHGTKMTACERGNRGRSKVERYRHISAEFIELPAPSNQGPLDQIIWNEFLAWLSIDQRHVAQCIRNGLTRKETAKTLGISLQAVNRIIAAARKVIDSGKNPFISRPPELVPDHGKLNSETEAAAGGSSTPDNRGYRIDPYTFGGGVSGLKGAPTWIIPGPHEDSENTTLGRGIAAHVRMRRDPFSRDSLSGTEKLHRQWEQERAAIWEPIRRAAVTTKRKVTKARPPLAA